MELKQSLYTTQSKNKHNMISSKYLCIIIVIHGFKNVTHIFFKQQPHWATQPGKSSTYFRIKIQSDTEYRLSNKSDFFFPSLFLSLVLDCPGLWGALWWMILAYLTFHCCCGLGNISRKKLELTEPYDEKSTWFFLSSIVLSHPVNLPEKEKF